MVTPAEPVSRDDRQATDLYLDLLARTLTRHGMDSPWRPLNPARRSARLQRAWSVVESALGRRSLALVRTASNDYERREVGQDMPGDAETMVGLVRLRNLRECLESIIADDVPGDVLEAGVWRGGASIFMRGVLAAHGVTDRQVWLADSFEGLPPPDLENFPQDKDIWLHTVPEMAASVELVRANFARYDLLDDTVHFLKGWFKDTMPTAPVDRLALLRVDGDMYESTLQVLEGLYDKVSPGGYIVIDDYKSFKECKQATDEFRASRGITDEIIEIDWTGVYWRRTA